MEGILFRLAEGTLWEMMRATFFCVVLLTLPPPMAMSRIAHQGAENTETAAAMLIPKKQRQTIYEQLFNDGVLVALKDFNAEKHLNLEVKNLFVIKSMQVRKKKRRKSPLPPVFCACSALAVWAGVCIEACVWASGLSQLFAILAKPIWSSSPPTHGIAPQTLKSKGMVTEKFAWKHYYWYLTEAGIEYLRSARFFFVVVVVVVVNVHKSTGLIVVMSLMFVSNLCFVFFLPSHDS